MTFINDRYPTVQKAASKTWHCEESRVCRGASIGSGSVILCGVKINQGAVVGGGSVVTKDVEAHTVVAGNPARILRNLALKERWSGGGRI